MGTSDLLLDLAEQSRSLHANSIDATNTLADQAQSIESMQASSASHLEKLGNLHHAFQQLKEPLVDLVQATSSDIHEHISESSTSITGLITMRSRDMEDLAVANQTMVLNELAALKDTVEALASGLENLPSSERNAVSVRRLVSQPALLRDAMDAQAQANDTRESQTRSPLVVGFANLIPCDCRGYRSLSSSGFRTKTTQFSWVRQDIYRHSPQCRFYASVNLNKTTKLSAEANFKTFNMLMRRALKITISLPWGAGGLGIGAQLSTRAIVDVGRSPSFQIIKWIGTALLSKSMSSGVQPRELIEDLVIIALGKLKEIFGCGKSSPRDVNMDGQTLLSFFLVMLEVCDITSIRLQD